MTNAVSILSSMCAFAETFYFEFNRPFLAVAPIMVDIDRFMAVWTVVLADRRILGTENERRS